MSSKLKPITIAGGGLAGLSLGIALRRRGIPVSVWEAGKYPRHKVCGEFISGRGQACLQSLGLRGIAEKASFARTALFFNKEKKSPLFELPQPALCISRYDLDAHLAEQFADLGGELRQGQRYTSFGERQTGVVRATGRRPQTSATGWRYFGLKVHARNVPLQADLEMHFEADRYVGLCRLPGGLVNICGLFRTRGPIQNLTTAWKDFIAGAPGSALHQKVEGADLLDDSFCSVAALSFPTRLQNVSSECRIGDTFAPIAPLAGNGMSIALESAQEALDPLTSYSQGVLSWHYLVATVANSCHARFSKRVFLAGFIQKVLFHSVARSVWFELAGSAPKLMEVLFRWTR